MFISAAAAPLRLSDEPSNPWGGWGELNWTVDGGVQQGVNAERDMGAAERDLTAKHRPAAGGEPDAPYPLAPEAASYQVVVGGIPAEPRGFRLRNSLLAELDQPGARVSVIHPKAGRQGLGATQLAAAYARAKLAAGWRLVAWVNAGDAPSTQAGLAAVAEAAGLAGDRSGPGLADAGQAVRHLLESDGDRCLLVFDNAADPEALRPFVPADGTAKVLITSTQHALADLAAAVPVDVFSADEALSFLVGQTSLNDEAGAAAVAAELGYLPLTLALAAPLISGRRHGYARYLDRLQTMPTGASLTGGDLPHPHSVARAVLLPLVAIQEADRTGMCFRTMAIMAALSAEVHRDLLHVAGRAGVLASGGRRVEAAAVDQVLEMLNDRSLLRFSLDGQNVIMHRLVAQVVRHSLARRGRMAAVCWVAASVLEAHAIAIAGSQDRPAARGIPQQVAALLANTAEFAGEADEELAEILLRLRFITLYHLIELGDSVQQAIAIGEPLTADLERLLDPGHPDTLNARNSLAAAYLAADRVADAIPLFEHNLAILQRLLGPDHPDVLTSRNNLASAYQDADRVAEAIQLYELNLAERERQLGVDHPSTLTSCGNLATAYLAAGRVAEAIPLLKQTLAGRDRVLGSDHPDTQTSRRNLARAYQDAGRTAEATSLLEQSMGSRQRVIHPDEGTDRMVPSVGQAPVSRASRAHANEAVKALPASFRRPPADPARSALPASFRRPPADPAGRLPSGGVASTQARLTDHSPSRLRRETLVTDTERDRLMVAAITAGDPAGIAMAYDRYAAALYGYCHWMLGNSDDAAASLQDTFVLAAATLSDRLGPAELRPWLFAQARNECRRRRRPGAATRDEVNPPNQSADEVSHPTGAADWLADETMAFPVISESPDAIRPLADAAAQFSSIASPADDTVQFRMVSESPDVILPLADATAQFPVGGSLDDATIQFRMFRESADATDRLADINGYVGQAELRGLIRSALADMKPREREVVELSFRHDLNDDDLAIALGMSESRAHALASRTRGRLEKSFGALRTALAGRQACPVVGELLADWDGQLNEQTRDLVVWHIEQCQTCRNQAHGALRPTVLSGLLPLTPLPPQMRAAVLSHCFSTAEDAVAYRRQVVRSAESTWVPMLSQAVRWVSWANIRANPGVAVATTAIAAWVAAAVIVLLLTFDGSHATHAQSGQPTGSHATDVRTAETPSPVVTQSSSPSSSPSPTA
jgi:RNA polymerase sigma factor (sigma-70 family)